MSRANPMVVLVGGPNGAGKSTSAPRLLKGALALRCFVNADVIARGLSGFSPDEAALLAGRVMWERMRELAAARRTFALETTLAGRSLVGWIRDELRPTGYRVHLIYLWLPSADVAVERVRTRVRSGGHDVPEGTIRRRYWSSLRNLFSLYAPLLDTWRVYNSQLQSGPALIAAGGKSTNAAVYRADDWARVREQTGYG